MFFNQSGIVTQKRKQAHLLFQRVISKPQKGLQQLGQYIKVLIKYKQISEIQQILNYFKFRNTHQITVPIKLSLISCFQCLINLIQQQSLQSSQITKYLYQLIDLVLFYFNDSYEKVRYQAVATIYNVIQMLGVQSLKVFNKVFICMLEVVSDQSHQIQVVLSFLNNSLKKLLNDAIFDHEYFDINQFMSILIQNFITQSTAIKIFLIDWLISIQQIPQFQISFYLPLFFKQLFKLMQCQTPNLRNKSSECLKNFLSGFKQLLRNRSRIERKIRQDSFSMLIGVLLEVIKELFDCQVKYHALQWLEVFTQLFYNQLIKKQHMFQVRNSFRGQYLLKEMKQTKNIHRQSKILSLIRQEVLDVVQNQPELSFLSQSQIQLTPQKQKDKMTQQSISNYNQKQVSNDILKKSFLKRSVINNQKVTEFLVEIFLSYYNKIIILVLHSLSDDHQKVRKTTLKINNLLIDSFPIVQDKAKISKSDLPIQSIITSQSQNYLQNLQIPLIIKLGNFLKQSRTVIKVQCIIRWIKILYQKGSNPQLNLQISGLTQKIVQKICQKTSSLTNFNKDLFHLLSDSIFMQKYLDLFIETLLSYFYQNQNIDSEKILINAISMKMNKDPINNTQVRYLTILRRLVLFQAQKGKFKQKMIQNLISILITEDSLSQLRKKLRNTPFRNNFLKQKNKNSAKQTDQNNKILQLIKQLFQYFCLNQAFNIIFCFLTGMYGLIEKILKYIASQNTLDRSKVKSFVKASNLLECYNLNHCKMDFLNNYMAIKAYLSFIMVLPPTKMTRSLLHSLSQQPIKFANEQQILYDEQKCKFENQLFEIYLQCIKKRKQQNLILQKQQDQKKQRERQRQATTTIQVVKPKQKSMLKQTSTSVTKSKVLKSSESQEQLHPPLYLGSKKLSLKNLYQLQQ